MSFAELGLSEKVLQAVTAAGYTEPTPIQAQAIPHVLAHRDVLGIAQTGTGKTAAFVLPMLTKLETGRARARMPRTLILEPTRELAAQVEENFDKYGINHRLSVALLIGGVSFGDQDLKITRGVDVLICTPGRLLDHVERGKLLLSGVELLVIDEADRMLDMGFIPDIERIVKLVPFTRQTLFFSATMPPEIQRLADAFLHTPVKVEVTRAASTSATITQRLVATGREAHEKRDTLRDLIRSAQDLKNAIVFCNRKRDVAILHRSLQKHGFNAAALHGDMDQRARMAALEGFRVGETTLLVASDVAARGLDIPAVSHVYNYDIPHHAEDYVHRIGRTGRAGRSGAALTLVGPGDEKSLAAIEKLIGQPIPWEGPSLSERPVSDSRPSTRRRVGRGEDRVRGRGRRSEGSPSSAPDAVDEVGPTEPRQERSARPPRERRPDRERGPRTEGERPSERTGRADNDRRSDRERGPRPEGDRSPERTSRMDQERRPDRDRGARHEGEERTSRMDQERRPDRDRGARSEGEERTGRMDQERRPDRDRGARHEGDRQHHKRRQDRDDDSVVGFGDHVPAFLLAGADKRSK